MPGASGPAAGQNMLDTSRTLRVSGEAAVCADGGNAEEVEEEGNGDDMTQLDTATLLSLSGTDQTIAWAAEDLRGRRVRDHGRGA